MFDVAFVSAESVGVNSPVRTAGPAAAGTHAHFAVNGVAAVVATASQPAMTFPSSMYFTTPTELAVPLIAMGPRL